jgi:hypothetical protein
MGSAPVPVAVSGVAPVAVDFNRQILTQRRKGAKTQKVFGFPCALASLRLCV